MKNLLISFISVFIFMTVSVGQAQIYGGGCQPTGDDTNYSAIAEFVTAGVYGGIPEITNIKATLNPGDNIQQAIDNGEAGVVYLNNGDYNIYEPIYLKSNVILRGQSKDGVKLKSIMYATGTKVNTLGIGADVSYAGIEDLTIEYAGATDIEPFVRNSLDGGYCAECFTNDPYGRDSLYVRLIFIGGDNNWVDNCNLIKSGTDPIYITGSASHNTIRRTLVDHSYNKGGDGNGYIDIRGFHNLITACTVRRIRHFTIQQGAMYNVVINNQIEVDVNFHNGDGGYNLIEGNTLLRPSWHAWTNFATGGLVYGHQPPGPNNYILNNTTYDYKDGISKFSDPDVIYTFLTYGSPTPTSWNVPMSGGTFYPVSCTSTNATIPLASISTSSTLELLPGLYTTLPITYSPENASNKSVVWSSNNTSVATVNSSGTVTAIAAGTATITATASEHTATSNVTVVNVGTESITETFENMTLSGWGRETYIGDYGVEWNVASKGSSGNIDGSKNIYMAAGSLGIQSNPIPGGISSFTVQCKDLYDTGVERTIELLINDQVIATKVHNGTEIYTFQVENINIAGNITIGVRNASPKGGSNKSLALDNIEWTSYAGDRISTLKEIKINDSLLNNFDANTYSYVVEIEEIPVITAATTSDKASVDITTPENLGDTAEIKVTAESGDYAIYYIALINPSTEIIENSSLNTPRIYPNPTNGIVYLDNLKGVNNIKMYSIQGELILNQKASNSNTFLDFGENSKGIFFVIFEYDSGKIERQKIIVK